MHRCIAAKASKHHRLPLPDRSIINNAPLNPCTLPCILIADPIDRNPLPQEAPHPPSSVHCVQCVADHTRARLLRIIVRGCGCRRALGRGAEGSVDQLTDRSIDRSIESPTRSTDRPLDGRGRRRRDTTRWGSGRCSAWGRSRPRSSSASSRTSTSGNRHVRPSIRPSIVLPSVYVVGRVCVALPDRWWPFGLGLAVLCFVWHHRLAWRRAPVAARPAVGLPHTPTHHTTSPLPEPKITNQATKQPSNQATKQPSN